MPKHTTYSVYVVEYAEPGKGYEQGYLHSVADNVTEACEDARVQLESGNWQAVEIHISHPSTKDQEA